MLTTTVHIPFDNSYVRLPPRFYAHVDPTPVSAPRLLRLNTALAEQLGIEPSGLRSPEGAEVLAGNRVPDGAVPIALAYAGHQFGGFSPQLGDGRAILLGEVVGLDGRRRDIQLKGSGPTPFSRRGDGRAALEPVLREYLISEAMAALGIPTTRALAAVGTGEPVLRERALPGAVLTRVAASHIRVGTFQFFAARNDGEAVKTLADYVIDRHGLEPSRTENPYRALLDTVIARQAELVAQWMHVGFIHGVMNTDNTSISGETIDYGPCAFMNAYDTATVFSSIDLQGRYAYGNQPGIMHWNMARLAEAMLPLLGGLDEGGDGAAMESAQDALAAFGPRFQAAYSGGLRRKIGLTEARDGDDALIQDLLSAMQNNGADFTLTFRALCAAVEGNAAVRFLFAEPLAYDEWAVRWRARLSSEAASLAERAASMRAVNPAVIPRNHLVEEALAAAVQGDLEPFDRLLQEVVKPFEDRDDNDRYTLPPKGSDQAYQTFCGT